MKHTKRRVARALAVLGLAGLMAGALAVPASAGKFDESLLPSLTVTKVVVAGENAYDIPTDSLFSIQVSCSSWDDPEDSFVDILTFNGDGSTHSAPGGWADGTNSWTLQDWDLLKATCTVTELAGGATQYLASSPTYTCDFSNVKYEDELQASLNNQSEERPDPGCLSVDGTGPAQVQIGHPWDRTCIEPDAIESEGSKCICVQTASITVTNTIADDPAKVLAGAVTVTPKFAG